MEVVFMVIPKTVKKRATPKIARGTVRRMVKGWMKDSKREAMII
jgi:hypothetical protein